ncbi:hypothetical protein RUM43_014305 [Polyplax serrata]|uniref:Serine/threonine-protein phosphatase n=1 Tax=Polyplax serrata TaxID=468196 RepID=A0AAN8PR33_POLSC
MNCKGSFQKICFCAEKFTENDNSESFNCSSSTISTAAESADKRDNEKKGKKEKGGIFSSFFNSKMLLRGFRKQAKTDGLMPKVERTIKAAILIQQWYRSYLARMEIRRRYTWTIFQSMEYQGEQDQVKVYDFFNALLLHMPECSSKRDSEATSKHSSLEFSDKFEDESSDTSLLNGIDSGYKGPHISIPVTFNDFQTLIAHFRTSKHRLHAKYVAGILKESLKELKKLPNLNQANTAISKQITVCGDLHGKLDDLLVIFHKNGLPSLENPYIFNGDFVDRGKKSLEILLLLLSCLTLFPGGIFLNRGNHEDHVMNQR